MNIDMLKRIADRVEAGGVCETLQYQLDQDVIINVPRSREALSNTLVHLRRMLAQSHLLERELEASAVSLRQEKKVSLDIKLENTKLLSDNAELAKQNRILKKQIDKLVSNGGL